MLGAVFERGAQGVGECFVFGGCGAAFDRAGDWVVNDATCEGVLLDEQLRACAYNLEVGARDVEEVGRWVDGAQVAVDVEGVQGCRACDTLAGHGLDDVAGHNVLLKLGDVGFVACAADVRGVFLVELDRWLHREREILGLEHLEHGGDGRAAGLVGVAESRSWRIGGGHVEVCDDHDLLEEVVQGDDGVEQAEPALRDLQHVFHVLPPRLRLEVAHTVVANITNGSTSHGRQSQGRNLSHAGLGQLMLQAGQRVGFEAMFGAGCKCLARIGADEAVSSNGASGGSGLQEERVV